MCKCYQSCIHAFTHSRGYMCFMRVMDFVHATSFVQGAYVTLCKYREYGIVDLERMKKMWSKFFHGAFDKIAFLGACIEGHLEVAQWLLSKGNVDIHTSVVCVPGLIDTDNGAYSFSCAGEDLAFAFACVNGHLQIAQWLYSLKGVDIHAAIHTEVFRKMCNKGHLEVARWLLSLDDAWSEELLAMVKTWPVSRDVWVKTVVFE